MIYWIDIPEKGDWSVSHRECYNWIYDTYPDEPEGQDHDNEMDGMWGWFFSLEPGCRWWFRDPTMATLFKLTWGGK